MKCTTDMSSGHLMVIFEAEVKEEKDFLDSLREVLDRLPGRPGQKELNALTIACSPFGRLAVAYPQ